MQSLYDLFGQRDCVVTGNKNPVTSFKHVQDAGILKQKSNTLSVKKKALGDVGNKINGENKSISSVSKPKAISSGLPNVPPKLKAHNLNKLKTVQPNTKKIQSTSFKLTHSIKPAERVPQTLKSKINVYVEELDDPTPKVEMNRKISRETDNCEETEELFFPDYDSFEDDDDGCQGPWLPRKLFPSRKEMFNLCSFVPIDKDEGCSLPDTMDVPFDVELDLPQPVNELHPFDLPLPMDVPLSW